MTEQMRTIDLTPSAEGFSQIGLKFADTILADVKKGRQAPDRELLSQLVKIGAHLMSVGRKDLVASLTVAIEQDEPLIIRTEALLTGKA